MQDFIYKISFLSCFWRLKSFLYVKEEKKNNLKLLVCLAQTMESFECAMCHCENPQDRVFLFWCKCNFPIWNALYRKSKRVVIAGQYGSNHLKLFICKEFLFQFGQEFYWCLVLRQKDNNGTRIECEIIHLCSVWLQIYCFLWSVFNFGFIKCHSLYFFVWAMKFVIVPSHVANLALNSVFVGKSVNIWIEHMEKVLSVLFVRTALSVW